MYYRDDDIKKLGTILGLWAHPDDETWCSAGIMCTAIANGQQVACITATRGEAGETADEARWPQAKLGKIRTKELADACNIIGVKKHYWLDYKDGTLAHIDEAEPIEKITKIIKEINPETILTFGKDGLTGHPDHKTLFNWAQKSVKYAGSKAQIYCYAESAENYQRIGKNIDKKVNIYFATDKPFTMREDDMDMCFRLDKKSMLLKKAALRLLASQTAHMFKHVTGRKVIEGTVKSEGFMRAPLI